MSTNAVETSSQVALRQGEPLVVLTKGQCDDLLAKGHTMLGRIDLGADGYVWIFPPTAALHFVDNEEEQQARRGIEDNADRRAQLWRELEQWKVWKVRCFQDAMMSAQERPPWVIEDLLLGESATVVSGLPHTTKSLSWLYATLGAVERRLVWGHFAAPDVESALFIETEDPTWLVEARIRGFAKDFGLSQKQLVSGFHYVCPGPFDLVKEEARLRGLLMAYKPSFAVLSTLQNLLGGRSWLKQDDMQPVMAAIIRLSRDYCPLIVLTHSPWDKKQRRAAGTVTQTANFLTTMHYQKIENSKSGETFVHVLVDSKAGAVESDFSLKLLIEGDPRNPSSVRGLEYAGKGWPKGLGKAAVLAALENDSDASNKEIAERAGVSERYVRTIRRSVEEAKNQQEEASTVGGG